MTGDVVNTASRLQGVAPAAAIVVGEATYRATRDRLRVRGAATRSTVKGKAEPAAGLAGATASRAGRRGRRAGRTHAVRRPGRRARDLLKEPFARTVRDRLAAAGDRDRRAGRRQDPAGLRVLRVHRRAARAGHAGGRADACRTATASRSGRSARSSRRRPASWSPTTRQAARRSSRRRVDAVVEDPPSATGSAARLAPLVGSPAASRRRPRGASCSPRGGGSSRRSRDERPAGAGLRGPALGGRCACSSSSSTCSTGPSRSRCWWCARPVRSCTSAHPGWGGGKRNSITISLPPLTDGETAVLVSSLLERAVLPAETQSDPDRAVGRQPAVRRGVRPDARRPRSDRPRAAAAVRVAELHDIPVPETLQALIALAAGHAAPEDKALLQDAAVIGKVFWSGALAAMCGCDEASVHDRLADVAPHASWSARTAPRTCWARPSTRSGTR